MLGAVLTVLACLSVITLVGMGVMATIDVLFRDDKYGDAHDTHD